MDQDIKEEFNKVQGKFDQVNKRVDKVVKFLQTKVALKSDLEDMENRLTGKMVTKDDIKKVMEKLDKVITTHDKHDKEHLVTNHRLEVLEAKVGVS